MKPADAQHSTGLSEFRCANLRQVVVVRNLVRRESCRTVRGHNEHHAIATLAEPCHRPGCQERFIIGMGVNEDDSWHEWQSDAGSGI